MIDFLWSLSVQVAVRSVLIIPYDIVRKLTPHGIKIQRNKDLPGALILHALDEALDYGDAAVFPHRSIPWPDTSALAPFLKSIAKED